MGGGILNGINGHLTVAYANFIDNFGADQGGGILNRGRAQVSHATFQGNSSGDSGGATSNVRTLIPNTSTYVIGDLTVTESAFVANRGADHGGALFKALASWNWPTPP